MFSVVIPLYNKQATIARALKSVFAQTYDQYEVIVVNDGSTDDSLTRVTKFASDKRVIIIDQENAGVGFARNKGASLARYPFIAFLDADDTWEPDYLIKVDEAIKKYPDAAMYCTAGFYREGEADDAEIIATRLAKKYLNKILKINYFENPHVFSHTSATTVSQQFFKEAGGFPEDLQKNEDFALFYQLGLMGAFVYIGLPLSNYFGGVHGQTTSRSKGRAGFSQHLVARYNIVHSRWVKCGEANKLYKVFTQYELRSLFRGLVKEKRYDILNYFIQNLSPGILRMFPSYERKMMMSSRLRHTYMNYVLATKIRWRLRGFPRVGA